MLHLRKNNFVSLCFFSGFEKSVHSFLERNMHDFFSRSLLTDNAWYSANALPEHPSPAIWSRATSEANSSTVTLIDTQGLNLLPGSLDKDYTFMLSSFLA